MILVTGASGNVGREVVLQLVARGEPVRVLARDPARAEVPDGVEVVAGDLGDPLSVHDAAGGVDSVFLLPGYPGAATVMAGAGVRRIVQLSGGSAASGDPANAVTAYMAASEREVLDADVEWTFLRPTAFMSNALRWKGQLAAGDVLRLPFADVPIALLDPADLAAVATVALAEDGHHAMIHKPTGPVALLPSEQVEILGAALGRPLQFGAQSNDEARRDMLTTTPPQYVGAFFDFYVNGSLDETTVRPTVQDVTGREPGTFAAWAERHAREFATA